MTRPAVVPLRPAGDAQKGDAPDWKALCDDTKRRLQIAEESLQAKNAAMDDLRGRMQKTKQRLESAQSENNRLQAQVVELTQRVEAQGERLARWDSIQRKVQEFRRSILEGPLWEVLGDLGD
jgi:chromosome segregation ATPase